ncbi:MAG: MBOAT family O-acyltransferase, partial [Microcystaceae cyanobacterium]
MLSVLGIYWSVAQQKLRLWTLLIASIVFYASLQLHYVPLLLVLIFFNFRLGKEIGEQRLRPDFLDWQLSNEEWHLAQFDWNRRRLKLLWLGIFLNIFLLLCFKYLLPLLGFFFPGIISSPTDSFKLIVPLGISFFTFECIAYLVDVYRGAPASEEFLQFAAYKFFFVKLISGPITRFHSLANQFKNLGLLTPDIVA